ncbi:MAG: CopG family transcriptional regulator [Clostridia bacterium]|nr:CopG family transcriptional regulator [Clostridia bacterium]
MNMHGLEPRMQLNIRIDRTDKENLEILAKADNRTLSDYIRLILEQHLKEKGLK